MRITVVGLGYVGLASAMILSQHNEVIGLDTSIEKINQLKEKNSPIEDADIEEFLHKNTINFIPTANREDALKNADIVIISTPTNYDPSTQFFDTSSVEEVAKDVIRINKNALMIIKSTIPVGFTSDLKAKLQCDNIIFSPEFLQEGTALHDNLYPSRIIIGERSSRAQKFADLLVEGARKDNIEIIYTDSQEAEAIKLFSNSYLAMRVAFFNELDTYAQVKNLDSKSIIQGVGLDPRVGSHYNNPSFGYGGYCFPKDTKQLLADFNKQDIPNDIITSIVRSNETRKDFIAKSIIERNPGLVGVYRLIMKTGSSNYRSSSIRDIMNRLKSAGIKIVIYEPSYIGNDFEGFEVIDDLKEFKMMSNLIIANRISDNIEDVIDKVFTRDLFKGN
jgi:UDPglucose 6-dehydrogenase